jgi:tetratricopeptide (TPR) repeat protein
MPTQMKIFISHSAQDKAICDQLVVALRGAGANVWYDEHNLGAGVLRDEIMRELAARSVVLIILSKAAFASQWVRDECEWAYNLYRRKPERLILPVVAGAYAPDDFDRMLYLESMKRVEATGNSPFPVAEMIARTLRALALTPAGERPITVMPQAAESLADLLTQGRALQAQKKDAEALLFFQRATQADPNSFSAWFNLGATLSWLKRYTEALLADERATMLDPNNATAWYNQGNTLNELKRHDEALLAYDKALVIDPNWTAAWNNKSFALNVLSRYEEALEASARSLAIKSSYDYGWSNKGIALAGLGRYEEGLTACDRALAINSSLAYAWYGKGFALYAAGRAEEALVAYDKALELEPGNSLTSQNKAIALRALGR